MIYFVSYPKSGRTWLKLLIQTYFEACNKVNKPYVFTHGGYSVNPDQWTLERIQNKILTQTNKQQDKLVVLTRSIPDTLASYYDDCCKRYIMYKGTLDEFVQDEDVGLENIVKFYQHLNDLSRIDYLISYEQMIHTPYESLTPIMEMLQDGAPVKKMALERTIKYCEFSNISKLERNNKIDMRNDNNVNGFYKARKGKIGSHKEEMSPELIKYIQDNIPKNINEYYKRVK